MGWIKNGAVRFVTVVTVVTVAKDETFDIVNFS